MSFSNAIKLCSGLVVIKNALSLQEQLELTNLVVLSEDKFVETTKTRLRIYDEMSTFHYSDILIEHIKNWLEIGNNIDNTILKDIPTHLLLLKYMSRAGMGFHQDSGENDGKGVNPIVSLSMGYTCDFLYKKHFDSIPDKVVLESGDVIMFGGASRMIFHSVKNIKKGNVPKEIEDIIGSCRVNFTCRYTPDILGKEKQFEIYDAAPKYK